MTTKTLTVKEVAEKLGTDGRTLRKFLRHEAVEAGGQVGTDTPGKGKRYAIPANEVSKMHKRFESWAEAKAKPEPEAESDSEEELAG